MQRLIITTICLMLGLGCIEAIGADWKFIGGSIIKSENVIAYYDAESVERSPNGNIRVWNKGVNFSEVERIASNEDVIEKSAKKLMSRYYPPYTLLTSVQKTDFGTYVDIISWEEAANHPELKSYLRIYYEINCNEKMIRELSIIVYTEKGSISSRSTPSAWNYISPETNGDTLHKILCKKNKRQ